ncbi:hypothetical protein CROQUDRAFT_685548, partial [Cronartium quercuum f. sp. fusiforme G11]
IRYSTDVKVQATTLLHECLSQVAFKHHLQSAVCLKTITCWKKSYESTLAVVQSVHTYQKHGQPPDFTGEQYKFMADLIEADPMIYLYKIHDSITAKIFVSDGPIRCSITPRYAMHSLRRKFKKVHPNQSSVKQAEYIDAIAALQLEMLVFAQVSLLGWYQEHSFKGHCTGQQQQTQEGVQYLLLPAINLDGLLAVVCQEGSYLCEDFEYFS